MTTPDSDPVPANNAGGEYNNKRSNTLDVRSTVSNPLGTYPTTNIAITYDIPRSTPPPVANNTSVETTEALKTFVNGIIDTSNLLISLINYEPKTVLLQMEELRKELNYASANYKATVPHPR